MPTFSICKLQTLKLELFLSVCCEMICLRFFPLVIISNTSMKEYLAVFQFFFFWKAIIFLFLPHPLFKYGQRDCWCCLCVSIRGTSSHYFNQNTGWFCKRNENGTGSSGTFPHTWLTQTHALLVYLPSPSLLQANRNCLVMASTHDIQELDVSSILATQILTWIDDDDVESKGWEAGFLFLFSYFRRRALSSSREASRHLFAPHARRARLNVGVDPCDWLSHWLSRMCVCVCLCATALCVYIWIGSTNECLATALLQSFLLLLLLLLLSSSCQHVASLRPPLSVKWSWFRWKILFCLNKQYLLVSTFSEHIVSHSTASRNLACHLLYNLARQRNC